MNLDLGKPLAVLADVRANLTALQAVLADLDDRGIRQGLVLGDLLAFGPDPWEVAELLFKRKDRFGVLLGHPSHLIVGASDIVSNPVANQAFRWARTRLMPRWWQLGKRQKVWRWLRSLPAKLTVGDVLFACGTPLEPLADFLPTIDPEGELIRRHLAATPRLAVVGTLSQPGYVSNADYRWQPANGICLTSRSDLKTIICPGGVGQPRDGDPRAGYAIVDRSRIEWVRVPYDVEKAVARFPGLAQLDGRHAHRLRAGR